MKRVNIKCPYCGAQALLRPASVLFGEKAIDPAAPYYVCSRYPACDSYVAAHRHSNLPMGTLADGALRRKRIDAHAAFKRLWESGLMTKRQAYRWLQVQFGLPESEAHIAKFSTFRCEQVIRLCDSFLNPSAKSQIQYERRKRHETRSCSYPSTAGPRRGQPVSCR